jgi:hypothetical protein
VAVDRVVARALVVAGVRAVARAVAVVRAVAVGVAVATSQNLKWLTLNLLCTP